MSSILDNPAIRQAALPITVEQYHRLGELGIIANNTELVRGVILEKMIKSPRHTWLVQYLADWLRRSLPDGFHVRQEQPLTLRDSEPEPDIAVVQGSSDDYRRVHPSTAALVVEVAVSTEELDREKSALYAAAGVTETWVLLADEGTIEVYTGPTPNGYANRRVILAGQSLASERFPQACLDTSRLA